MIKKIDHIAIAVKNLGEAVGAWYNLFGLLPDEIENVPNQKVRVAIIQVGKLKIEIMEPTDPESPIAKFLDKRGEGLHNIAFKVKNVDKELKHLSELKVELIDRKGREGLAGKIGFLHPKSANGVLVELVQNEN